MSYVFPLRSAPVCFFCSQIYMHFLSPKIFAASRRIFSYISVKNHEIDTFFGFEWPRSGNFLHSYTPFIEKSFEFCLQNQKILHTKSDKQWKILHTPKILQTVDRLELLFVRILHTVCKKKHWPPPDPKQISKALDLALDTVLNNFRAGLPKKDFWLRLIDFLKWKILRKID